LDFGVGFFCAYCSLVGFRCKAEARMISKFLVLSLVAVVATASEALENAAEAAYVRSTHDDTWCHNHHLGSGSTSCVQNNGCCFSSKVDKIFSMMKFDDQLASDVGPCHSCESHSDDWCAAFGTPDPSGEGDVWDNCVANSGCTFTEAKKCHSAAKDVLVTRHNCATQLADASGAYAAYSTCLKDSEEVQDAAEKACLDDRENCAELKAFCEIDANKVGQTYVECQEGFTGRQMSTYRVFLKSAKDGGCLDSYTYKPVCAKEGSEYYAAEQSDGIRHVDGVQRGQYFCVSTTGHEIPNTRRQVPLDTAGVNIDCEKYRSMADGFQCPNSMVLSSSGGVVSVNKDSDALDCTTNCASDQDCANSDRGWCCFNGCNYQCHQPVKPFTGCAQPPIDSDSQTLEDVVPNGFDHEMQVTVRCAEEFSVAPGLDTSVRLTCSHGRWLTDAGVSMPEDALECMQECPVFDISKTDVSVVDGLKMNRNDYVIEGDDNHFGATREISCVPHYGIVAGDKKSQTLTCGAGGVWSEEFDGTTPNQKRTIECSVCFDDADFRSNEGNHCSFYQSRPLQCADGAVGTSLTPQQKSCRVACRTCREAEFEFGVKDVRMSVPTKMVDGVSVKQTAKWTRKIRGYWETKTMKVKSYQEITVTKQLPLWEACKNADGNTKSATKNESGDFYCDGEGYELMGEDPNAVQAAAF